MKSNSISGLLSNVWAFLAQLPRRFALLTFWQKVISVGALLLVLVLGWYAVNLGKSKAVTVPEVVTHTVQVQTVADLSAAATPLSAVGSVSSKSEATVLAQSAGEVVAVNRALGDYVSAGDIVAQMENSSQRAAVMQAKGAVDAANANLNKVKGGTRTEQLSILKSGLDSAKSGAVNALLSAYAAVDGAVKGSTDPMFSNPTGTQPHFNVTTSNTQARTNAENMRATVLVPILNREIGQSTSLAASSDLGTELSTTETELRTVRSFLDTVLLALGAGISGPDFPASVIAGDIAAATAARASVTGALSGISGARAALEVAQKSLDQGVTGAQTQDIDAIAAALTSAQGGLAAAQANLEKTYIRAPISGTVNSFSLKRGDFVQMFSPVLTVANNGTLEIVAQITQDDAQTISVGGSVTIEGSMQGVIRRIAPALDPQTKKVEVRIDVVGPQKELANGQSVIVSFSRAKVGAAPKTAAVSIPISAIKVGSDAMTIFTVSTSSALVSHVVTVGQLQGDRVIIATGLTPDMSIVVDARGLREGEVVTVK